MRRGDPDAAERLADLAAQAVRASEPQRLAPLVELETEWALTTGAPMPVERFEALLDGPPRDGLIGWGAVRSPPGPPSPGSPSSSNQPPSAPYAAMLRRDWAAAADAFGDVGWSYDRALMLSLLDDEEALLEALEIARGLGAEPLARRVASRMRELGAPHPARAARRDPGEPGRADAASARGAGAARGRLDERRDRRPARRLAANGRAPRRRGDDQARRVDAPRRRAARLGARARGAPLTDAVTRSAPGSIVTSSSPLTDGVSRGRAWCDG